ncbi:hypothetical protein NDU88_001116 [Pleurodeles waltl]|uniref:Uncharacterized protein n=1 Tax=Pleurodeles waltl TaxID=8319 RepID=A0AAV7S902_PLEWA|nr:hypothetical protein NDU88_001116 [Pleurodeles waltl]
MKVVHRSWWRALHSARDDALRAGRGGRGRKLSARVWEPVSSDSPRENSICGEGSKTLILLARVVAERTLPGGVVGRGKEAGVSRECPAQAIDKVLLCRRGCRVPPK